SFANVDTVSYGPGVFNGTSSATPHVAGMAALLKQLRPGFTPEELVQRLRDISAQGSNDLGVAGPDVQDGWGGLSSHQESARAVVQQPAEARVGALLPEVEVDVRDTEGLRVLSGPTGRVDVAIGADPSGGSATLSGTSAATV